MRLIPDLDVAEALTNPLPTLGELYLFKQLAQTLEGLPEVDVFFQPRIGGIRPDIVVVRRNYGCTIIEVKDWSIDAYKVKVNLDNEAGSTWTTRTGNHVYSPHAQVVSYKRKLLSEAGLDAKKRFNSAVYGTISTLVFLSNTAHEAAKGFSHKYVNFIGRDGLQSDTTSLLNQLGLARPNRLFDNTAYDSLLLVLDPSHTPRIPKITVKPTSRQSAALRFPATNRRKIRGVAGSGKTVIGAMLAAEAANQGGSVFIAVYNEAAKSATRYVIDHVDIEFPRGSVVVETIFKFSRPFHTVRQEDFLLSHDYFVEAQENIPASLLDRVALPDYEKFDLIIIDEAQDYNLKWMQLLESHYLKEHGRLVVLADEGQNIYGHTLEDRRVQTPISGQWFRLNEHKRAQPEIARVCDSFRKRFLGDDEETDYSPSLNLSIVKGYAIASNRIESLVEAAISVEPVLSALTQEIRKESGPLVIARTNRQVRQLSERAKSVRTSNILIRSTVETDLQRCHLFLEAIKSVFTPKQLIPKCNGRPLSMIECNEIRNLVGPTAKFKSWNELVSVGAEHLYSKLLSGPDTERTHFNSFLTTLFSEVTELTDRANQRTMGLVSNEYKQENRDDIAHIFSFAQSALRTELKYSVFSDTASIVTSTVHSSKGVERNAVVIVVDDKLHLQPQANEILYTALSRSIDELHVVYDINSKYANFFADALNQH